MKLDPEIHHRHSIRIAGYDYSNAGAYAITIVAHGKECLFGEIINSAMKLNSFGKIVQETWFGLPKHYPNCELDVFCILPDHVHGILVLTDHQLAGSNPFAGNRLPEELRPGNVSFPSTDTCSNKNFPLSEIVRAFKSFSAKRINKIRKVAGIPVWQRNYYEHIIRNNEDYLAQYWYILNNPSNWKNLGRGEEDDHP